MQKIVKLRQQRRDLLAGVLDRLMEQGFLDQLNSIEKKYGIQSAEPLTANVSLEQLAPRLAVIEALHLAEHQQ